MATLSLTTSVVVGRVVEVECSSGQVWRHLTPPLNFVVVNVHEMGYEICEAGKIAMWHWSDDVKVLNIEQGSERIANSFGSLRDNVA